MRPDSDNLTNIKKEYVERNVSLISIIYSCYEMAPFTYEELVVELERIGENSNGLLIKLENGKELKLIEHEGASSLKEGEYWLIEEGAKLYEEYAKSIAFDNAMKLLKKEKLREKREEEKFRRYCV